MYEVYLLFKYTFNSPSMRSYDTAPTIVTYPTAVPVTSTCSDKLLPASHFFKPNNYTTAHSLQILAVIGENYTYFVEPMSYFTYIDGGHYQLGLYFSIHCQYIYIKSGIWLTRAGPIFPTLSVKFKFSLQQMVKLFNLKSFIQLKAVVLHGSSLQHNLWHCLNAEERVLCICSLVCAFPIKFN